MSLDWNITKVRDREALYIKVVQGPMGEHAYFDPAKHKDPDARYMLNPVTDALVWATIPLCIGHITERGWREFYQRVQLYEFYRGPLVSTKHPITPAIIHRHIGLTTNVTQDNRRWRANLSAWQNEAARQLKEPEEPWAFAR